MSQDAEPTLENWKAEALSNREKIKAFEVQLVECRAIIEMQQEGAEKLQAQLKEAREENERLKKSPGQEIVKLCNSIDPVEVLKEIKLLEDENESLQALAERYKEALEKVRLNLDWNNAYSLEVRKTECYKLVEEALAPSKPEGEKK